MSVFNWENLEPGGTQTQVSHMPGEHLYHLDHWVHSFPVTTLDTQELDK